MIAVNYDGKIHRTLQAGDMISHDSDVDRSHDRLHRDLYVYTNTQRDVESMYRFITFSVRSLPSIPLSSSQDHRPAGIQAESHAKYQTRRAMSQQYSQQSYPEPP